MYDEAVKSKVPTTEMTKQFALEHFSKAIEACIAKDTRETEMMDLEYQKAVAQ